MPFLVKADFKTHLYAEVIDSITRADDDIITRGITGAISETKSYLSRYDLLKIFGDSTTEPIVADENLEHLKEIVKDIAVWKMVKLSNPNVDLKLFRTIYEDALSWLKLVQKGQADPDGWPYKEDDPATPGDENSGVQWSSNKKRTQSF